MAFYLFMSGCNKSKPKDTLVIFWTFEFGNSIDLEYLHELRRNIHSFQAEKNAMFDQIMFITPKYNSHQFVSIENFFKDNKLTYTLSLKDLDRGLIFSFFDEKGRLHILGHTATSLERIRKNVLLAGVATMFSKWGGVVGPSDYFHYILPSGVHSNVFVRVGNIFRCGVEIDFFAFALLPFFHKEVKYVYCDTSSIIVGAQSAVLLKKRLAPGFICPDIVCFRSYAGVQDFYFKNAPESLILVSASSSGDLTKIIYDKIEFQTTEERIVSLFKIPYNQHDQAPGQPIKGKVIFDLEKQEFAVSKEQLRYYHSDCLLCKKDNSAAIPVTGDDFLPEKRRPHPVLVTEKNKPEWFNGFMNHFIGKKYISCHRSKKGGGNIRELYLDIDLLHKNINKPKNKHYREIFYKYLHQKLPAALTAIIYLEDSASETIARQIQEFYCSSTKSKSVTLIKYSDNIIFSSQLESALKGKQGCILVAGSSIAQSRTILNISRELRKIHESGCQLCYFVSIVRTYTQEEFKHIKTNLVYGFKYKHETHSFDSLFKIFIPDERYRTTTPWQEEMDALIDFFVKGEADKLSSKAKKLFQDRLSILKAAGKKGLVNDLFWFSPNGDRLGLNPGFVFFDFNVPSLSSISQADVYFTISIILHYLRTEKEGVQIPLEQTEHQRKILDPQNFNRFNDAVIQASILRAAKPIELDYSYDDLASATMSNFLFDTIKKKEGACYEFMLGLALEKIKLTPGDTKSLIGKLNHLGYPMVSAFIALYQSRKEKLSYF